MDICNKFPGEAHVAGPGDHTLRAASLKELAPLGLKRQGKKIMLLESSDCWDFVGVSAK